MPWAVEIIEAERGWGTKVDSIVYFNDREKADAWVKDYNKCNTAATAPDWYMQASTPTWVSSASVPVNAEFEDDEINPAESVVESTINTFADKLKEQSIKDLCETAAKIDMSIDNLSKSRELIMLELKTRDMADIIGYVATTLKR